ncbi:hypothetical protein AAEH85_22060, partial [Shewanella algae]|uniref:hypothetical protein n=1 Tax=Shewanella algae TaxID=38313 RepID=UPI00313F51D1
AEEMGCKTLGLLGFAGGKCLALCDEAIVVRSEDFGIIEDSHSVLNHLLTQYMKSHVQNPVSA